LWANQVANFGGFRLAWSWELLPRLKAWLDLGSTLFGSPKVSILFLILFFLLLGFGWYKDDRGSAVDKLLLLFTLGYMLLQWLVAIPIWDRYLLPMIPIWTITMARGLTIIYAYLRSLLDMIVLGQRGPRLAKGLGYAGLLVILLFMLPGTISAREGKWPVGGQPTADQGAWQVADYLADSPYGTVLYDHWTSWYWGYHLFDSGIYLSWFPHPAALVEDLVVFGSGPETRYLLLPDDGRALPVFRAVNAAGFLLEPVLHTDTDPGLRLYKIERNPYGQDE
jgi:hypothetical protein